MSSLHLGAKVGEIAETVLLPGDPLRAKYVAENLLDRAECYSKVRGMLGYTGYYRGKRVSIQGTGMGMGSTGIYIHELIHTYGVKNLIRVGTCGSIQKSIGVGEIILALSASGDSSANALYFKGMQYAATADFDLLLKAHHAAKAFNINTIPGIVFSTDNFYDDNPDRWNIWEEHGVLGVDMESQILYTLAKRFNVQALSILTVSDNIITGKALDAEEREKSCMDMMRIGFELALDED